ncbi:MAG: DUF5677 domain-containing protein [Phycicoccus sp.]|uniref:DUF5677 domain-containing protein n=1 Tax=Phycicoccus TaxID=367298 RepID=UPI001D67C9C9|nr:MULTISPECIES: DUF5677 domain-containing protein [Phycicoccus]MCB1238149.1 hypothetical protein [Tetrasphaera sp.]MCB9406013.1 hypothetical protein [Tetrasphaera sp.]MCO5301907.1 DUF5677 domain-containing protein [Phycicoccus sp.]HPQ74042.1 DUF5677 domain-containing protein [Phycicoccus elongatus]
MTVPRPYQHAGPLAGHVRKGRVYSSPLAATGALQVHDWFKDDLPDLLWPALVLAEQGNESVHRFVRWQKAVQDGLAAHGETTLVAESLYGRLTHLAVLAAKFSDAAELIVAEATRYGLLSVGVRSALGSYPYMPAPWLAGQGQVRPPGLPELQLIRSALLAALKDGHLEALLKCLRTWSTVQAGSFRSDEKTIDILKNYPGDSTTRSAADSAVRAMWGAHRGAVLVDDPNHFDEAIKWARVFWGANSMTSRCVRKRESEGEDEMGDQEDGSDVNDLTSAEEPSGDAAAATPVPADGAHLRGLTMDLLSSFVEALETAPARLHDNERQEVISGLVVRAGRDLIAVLTAPDLWCMEHGAHIVRMLVESKIYLHWMAQQDPSIYREFQEYGAGKAKLYARISDEVPAEAREAGFQEAIEEFERLSHNHDVLDHRVVDTRDTFAGGTSIRAMAEETGLLDFYRQAYSLASGVAHSEWWSIETHAMEPCLNVLHGLHLIPSLSLSFGGNVPLASSWVDQFYSLIRTALRILDTDGAAVSAAFAWLEESAEEELEAVIEQSH